MRQNKGASLRDRAATPSEPNQSSVVSGKAGIPSAAELALLCEQMPEGNRELDVLIAVMIDWRWPDWEEGESTARGQAEKHGIDWLIGRATEGFASMWRHIPRYTASLDAAMELVPDGFDWIIGRTNGGLTIHAEVGGRGDEFRRFGNTPALALCAGALRARAAIAMEAAKPVRP